MKAAFVTLQINGKEYDAISYSAKFVGGYFRILNAPFPIIGFMRPVIYRSWINQEWFNELVPDFSVT